MWRRIPNWPDFVVRDRGTGEPRPSSMAFKDDRDGDPTSVYLADEALTTDAVMAGHEGFGLAAITAEVVHACGLDVVRRAEPGFPYHAVLVGPKTDSVARKLARAATWVIHISAVD